MLDSEPASCRRREERTGQNVTRSLSWRATWGAPLSLPMVDVDGPFFSTRGFSRWGQTRNYGQ